MVSKENFLDRVSTHFLICEEMISGKGEDSGLEAFNECAGIVSAFDGCGGLGAMTYPDIQSKTGAWLASRVACGAVKDWFESNCRSDGKWNDGELKQTMVDYMSICSSHCGNTALRIKGSMIRPFPTTMAAAVCYVDENRLISKHIWAGDSRTYFLTADGLVQISEDDIDGEDALSNLSNDGVLTNVIAADKNYSLHSKKVEISGPCIILAATDGCFGYLSSPMMFEYMLLDTLERTSNVYEWQSALKSKLGTYSEDDYTLALAAFGYDTFNDLKDAFYDRQRVIKGIHMAFEKGSREEQAALWKAYSKRYYRL